MQAHLQVGDSAASKNGLPPQVAWVPAGNMVQYPTSTIAKSPKNVNRAQNPNFGKKAPFRVISQNLP
jgi:hypothetical protein